uniref:Sulfotransferase domain-containing protein n=1 Tax=Alexandrium catenella TaxID=2925 RepID=A0A7S1L6W1_ALECA
MASFKNLACAALVATTTRLSSALRVEMNATASAEPVKHLFVAGVMGSGLEFWQHIMRECVDQRVCELRDTSFYTSLMYQGDDEESLKKQWGLRRPKAGSLVPMNLLSPVREKFGDKIFLHPFSGESLSGNVDPNLALYAKVAKSFGDSFKVLVLTRQDEASLVSFTMRMLKLSAEEAEKVVTDNVRTLTEDIRKLPRSLYRCQRYEDLKAYGPHMSPLLKTQKWEGQDSVDFAQQATVTFSHGCQGWRFKKANKCASSAPKLRDALDELESLCSPQDVATKAVSLSESGKLDQEAVYSYKVRWLTEAA